MDNKEIKYWTLVFLLNFVPTVGFHFLIRPMWFKGVDSFTTATTIELFFTTIALPIYLVVTNYYLASKFEKQAELIIINGLIVISCILISTHLHFKNWAESIGNSVYPDSKTIGLMDIERIIGLILSTIGLFVIYFRLRAKNLGQVRLE